MLSLPADVLLMICEELGNKNDFDTLYKCALTGKSLAGSALLWLYRIHNRSPIINSEGNDQQISRMSTYDTRKSSQMKTISMWALQWRSMTRSSLGLTLYPYCLYIRSLDLRTLKDLLDDPLFREAAMDRFFADDMAVFLDVLDTPMKQKMRGAKKKAYMRLDIPKILRLIGESITTYISQSAQEHSALTTVEELTGEIDAGALLIWTKRLSNLRTLTLWDGCALSDELGSAIAAGCFHFDDITFYQCTGSDADHRLSSFFGSLRKNTLRSFNAIGANAIGPESLLSLKNHSKSLRVLKLDGLRSAGIKNLSLLQGCDSLNELAIADADGLINLEATENDIFLETVAWLSRCKNIRELSFKKLVSGPAILSRLFANNEVKLRGLQLYGYSLHSNQEFHRTLARQTSLESLILQGDPEGGWRDDIDTMISSLTQLKRLETLKLLMISEYFRSSEIISLATELKQLRTFDFGGYDVNDSIWPSMSGLHHLHTLNVQALTSFTPNGILAYISTVQDTNQNLLLSVMNQRTENPFTEEEQQSIKDSLVAKVTGGKFDFVLFREADSEDESDSD